MKLSSQSRQSVVGIRNLDNNNTYHELQNSPSTKCNLEITMNNMYHMISLIDCETKRVFPIGYSNKKRKRIMEHFKRKFKKIRTHLSMGGVNHQVLSYLNTRYFYFLVIIDEIQLCNFWSIQDLSLFKVQFLLQMLQLILPHIVDHTFMAFPVPLQTLWTPWTNIIL